MADWDSKTVNDVVTKIQSGVYVLPVIQRGFVWDEYEMLLLFNSLLKGYSFGSIIGLKEKSGRKPLFAYRTFSLNEIPHKSEVVDRLTQDQFFVIDGQQRLQTFFIGLCGSYKGREVYFDLYSDYQKRDYDFKFATPGKEKSSVENSDRAKRELKESECQTIGECFWYSVKKLYSLLDDKQDSGKIADIIARNENEKIEDKIKLKHIERNIACFFDKIFKDRCIGLSRVFISKDNENDNRQWLVELFRRLNSGGTTLSALDLVASKLKGYDYRTEKFLEEVVEENKNINLKQDEIVKLLMVLKDKPLGKVTDLDEEIANFAVKNADEIKSTLRTLQNFLKLTDDYNWSAFDKNHSPIPLYILEYHIFYSKNVVHGISEGDIDFAAMKKWLHISQINGIFRRGCGWTPSESGLKKLHIKLCDYKGKIFPAGELFDVCKSHPLHYFSSTISVSNLDKFNRSQDYILYLIYDGKKLPKRDVVDHIHPCLRLISRGISEELINDIGNLELLSSADNNEKSDKKLGEWIKKQSDRQTYLEEHLTPENINSLWTDSKFVNFLKERRKMIVKKITESV